MVVVIRTGGKLTQLIRNGVTVLLRFTGAIVQKDLTGNFLGYPELKRDKKPSVSVQPGACGKPIGQTEACRYGHLNH